MGRLLKWLVLVAVIAAGGAYWYKEKENAPKIEAAQLGKVTRGDMIQRVNVNGFVVPRRKSIITSSYAGYVRKIYVNVGDDVKAGDPIVMVSQSADSAANDSFPLRAPFAGKVVQILKSEGEYVVQGVTNSGLVRIDDLTNLFVQSNAPEVDFPKLKVGLEVVLKPSSAPSKTYKGRIVSIFQAAKEQDNWERSRVEFPINIEVLDEDQSLKPGMTVVIDVITAQSKDALLVRHEFLQRDGDKIFVTTADGKRVDVEVGLQNEEAFEIKSGVTEGMSLQQVDFAALAKER